MLCWQLGIVAVFSLSVIPAAFAQYQTEVGEDLFILVQTTLRNSDGTLVTYLESSKFTDLNLPAMESFLDFEASRGNDPVINIGDSQYQVIRRAQTVTFDSETVVASTNLFDTVEGQQVLLARFAHDGYPAIPGDTLESVWTFLRKV